MCSGKVYYDLLPEAEKLGDNRPAIVRLEQLYTFPWAELRQVLPRYRGATELVWVQEEPLNMGAWRYLEAKLRELVAEGPGMEIRTWVVRSGPVRRKDTQRPTRPSRAGSSGRRWSRAPRGPAGDGGYGGKRTG